MGNPLNPEDLLATALRQSRASVADDGFSARVAARVAVLRRRQKLARAVRVFCAISTLFLSGVIFGYVTTKSGMLLAKLLSYLASIRLQIPSPLGTLNAFGLPSWTLAIALAAVIIVVAIRTAERDTPLRF